MSEPARVSWKRSESLSITELDGHELVRGAGAMKRRAKTLPRTCAAIVVAGVWLCWARALCRRAANIMAMDRPTTGAQRTWTSGRVPRRISWHPVSAWG